MDEGEYPYTEGWKVALRGAQVAAFLSGVEGKKDLILLDLMSDLKPIYDKAGDNGKQFIWGSLPNFGAVKGVYGDLDAIAEGPMKAHTDYPDYFVGIGAFMEGIDQNVVVYDMLYEMSWRTSVNVDEWLQQYAKRRYGFLTEDVKKVWSILREKAYRQRVHFWLQPPMIQEPSYSRTFDLTDFDGIVDAYNLMRKIAKSQSKASEPFYYDFVDITRQNYQNLFAEELRVLAAAMDTCFPYTNEYDKYENTDSPGSDIKHQSCEDAFGERRQCTVEELKAFCNAIPNCAGFNSNGYLKSMAKKGGSQRVDLYARQKKFVGNICLDRAEAISKHLLGLIKALDAILHTNKNFQLGVWTQGAIKKSASAVDEIHTAAMMEKAFVYSAKNQVTLWGPNGEINDYSAREWADLMGEYYYGRWTIYFDMLFGALKKNETMDLTKYHKAEVAFGEEWDSNGRFYAIHHVIPTSTIEAYHARVFEAATKGYEEIQHMTVVEEKAYFKSKTTHKDFLFFLCSTDPKCGMFNSNGFFFYADAERVPDETSTLFIKQ